MHASPKTCRPLLERESNRYRGSQARADFRMQAIVRTGWPLLLALAWGRNAAADLHDDVTRLSRAVKTQKPYHLGPRVLEQGEELPLLVPDPLTPKRPVDCLHVVALSAPSTQFVLSVPADGETVDDVTIPSRAGLLEFVHCGMPDASFGSLSLVMLSPRGAVDLIGYIDQNAKAGASKWLPWREAGREANELRLQHRVAFGELNERLKRLERHAAFHAADRTERKPISAQDLDSGELLVGFDPGCHEVQLVIDLESKQAEAVDLNPDLAWIDDGELAARNISSSPSPTFRVCTGTARIARLSFAANPAYHKAVLFRAHYPWPGGIPANWASQARDQMALAMFRRHLPSLPSLPAQSWIGNSSATSVSMTVSPRSCYLAIVATSHGSQNDVSLAISDDSRWIADASLDDVGASVAFCVGQASNVKMDVDARGTDAVWILGVWAIANGPLFSDFT